MVSSVTNEQVFRSSDLRMERFTAEALAELNREVGRQAMEAASSSGRSSSFDYYIATLISEFGKSLLEKRLEIDKQVVLNRGLPFSEETQKVLISNLDETYSSLHQDILTPDFYRNKSTMAMTPAAVIKHTEALLAKHLDVVRNEVEIFILDGPASSVPVSPPSIEAASEDFTFVQNPILRDLLIRDYTELLLCHQAGAVKATLIMSGSVLEALLLDALLADRDAAMAHSARGKEALENWALDALLSVALTVCHLNPDVMDMSTPVRKMRNLVHPGKELRENPTFDQSEATIAMNVVKIVIRGLRS